jgi:hypothetical protein
MVFKTDKSKKATAGHQRRREREQRELAAVAAGPAEEGACSEVADGEDTRAAATQRDKSKEAARARQVETFPFCASIFAPLSNALNQFDSENRRFARRFAVASPSLRRRFAVASPSLRRRFARHDAVASARVEARAEARTTPRGRRGRLRCAHRRDLRRLR